MIKKVQRRLWNLFTGELTAALLFALLWGWFSAQHNWVNPYLTGFPLYMFIVLELILLQGSLYWYLKWRKTRLGLYSSLNRKQIHLFTIFNWANLVLITIGSILLIIHLLAQSKGVYWGCFLFAFAIIEYINYYYIRLSYLSAEEISKWWAQENKWQPSILARELNRRKK